MENNIINTYDDLVTAYGCQEFDWYKILKYYNISDDFRKKYSSKLGGYIPKREDRGEFVSRLDSIMDYYGGKAEDFDGLKADIVSFLHYRCNGEHYDSYEYFENFVDNLLDGCNPEDVGKIYDRVQQFCSLRLCVQPLIRTEDIVIDPEIIDFIYNDGNPREKMAIWATEQELEPGDCFQISDREYNERYAPSSNLWRYEDDGKLSVVEVRCDTAETRREVEKEVYITLTIALNKLGHKHMYLVRTCGYMYRRIDLMYTSDLYGEINWRYTSNVLSNKEVES